MTNDAQPPEQATEESAPPAPPLYRDRRTASFAAGERVREFQSFERQAKKRPIYPIHPGEILADELAELGMTPAGLARALHVPSNRIYQLIAGRRAMTADTALRLEQWLGVEAAFWMNLQKSYELDLAAEQIGEEIKRTVAHRQPIQPEQTTGLTL